MYCHCLLTSRTKIVNNTPSLVSKVKDAAVILHQSFSDSYQGYPDSKVHGANMGLTGPRWAPCWPHELCCLGWYHKHLLWNWSPMNVKIRKGNGFMLSGNKALPELMWRNPIMPHCVVRPQWVEGLQHPGSPSIYKSIMWLLHSQGEI